jgi:hypothetical protein
MQQYPKAFTNLNNLKVYCVSVVPDETEAIRLLFKMHGVDIVEYSNFSFFPKVRPNREERQGWRRHLK